MPGQQMVDLYDDFYSDKPLFLADMLTQELRYNSLMDQLDELEADGRICCVRPQEPITIGRFEGDENKLLDLYNRGHRRGPRGDWTRCGGIWKSEKSLPLRGKVARRAG